MSSDKIIKGVGDYYTSKLMEYGPGPKGVDWNSTESQYVRFKQLSTVIDGTRPFSVLDYGCGYGEYLTYLRERFAGTGFDYVGYDISEAMIEAARNVFGQSVQGMQFDSQVPSKALDYCVASGIFNVRLDLAGQDEWLEYILQTLNSMHQLSEKGFAFNALTKYSDPPFMKDYLYYADPLFLFDYCKRHFSRQVALLHDYELYEFTILVRKHG